MRPIQTAAGHQARRRLGRDTVKSVFNSVFKWNYSLTPPRNSELRA
jgi:hypothetical protein